MNNDPNHNETPGEPTQRSVRPRAVRVPVIRKKLKIKRVTPAAAAHPAVTELDTAALFSDVDETTIVSPAQADEIAEAIREIDAAADASTVSAPTAKAQTPTASAGMPQDMQKPRKQKMWLWILLACAAVLLIGYLTFAFCPVGFIARWRTIYIQTAMSTGDHQWLATAFLPKSVIDACWTDPFTPPEHVEPSDEGLTPVTTEAVTESGETHDTEVTEQETAPETEENTFPDTDAPDTSHDILGLADLRVGGKDPQGSTVTVLNEAEGLYIAEFSNKGWANFNYHGYVMLVDDPARVFVGSTPEKDERGYRMPEMMDYYGDVVAGINASGFADPNDSGAGNEIIGACMSEGEFWGSYTDTMESIVLTDENRLIVGWLGNWKNYSNIRDGMQFGPAIVTKGQNKISEKDGGGRGLHPRTAIGQREDGSIIMIVIDGRVTSSVGCTLWDMAEMMVAYGAVTAGCCDGGSSVVLAYEGEILNDNSSANPSYGRRIPNAFLVRSKDSTKIK